MASNQKVEDHRPPLKFHFAFWEVFSALYTNCILDVYTMYTVLVSGIFFRHPVFCLFRMIIDN